MRGSDLLVKAMVEAGVKYVFGMSGHSTSAVLDSISQEPRLRFILAKHENTLASMADAIGRITQTPTVCVTHSGPSAANAITGLAGAFRDSSPVVLISCNEEQSRIPRDVMNGWDQLTPFRSITKWSVRPSSAKDIPRLARNAFVRATLGRPGPVQIDMPFDIAEQEVADLPEEKAPSYGSYSAKARPDPDLTAKIAELLMKAKQPLILSGAGVNWSNATADLVQFAELTGVPVANTTGGRGTFPENHKLFVGVPGRWGHRTASEAMKAADFVLAVGARLSDVSADNWKLISNKPVIVQVDIDPTEIARQYPVDVGVIADCGMFLRDIIPVLKPLAGKAGSSSVSAWAKALNGKLVAELKALLDVNLDAVPVTHRRLLKEIGEVVRDDTIVSIGGGRHSHFISMQLPRNKPRSNLRSIGFGAIGFAYPAALGAKLACPDRQVLCLVGDGDFSQSMEAVETAVREKINVVAVIFNDSCYSSVKILQQRHYGRNIGVDFSNPDFAKYAEVCGAKGFRVEKPGEIRPALEAALKANRPCLIDVIIDPLERTGFGVFSK